jgi:hypothetical protein
MDADNDKIGVSWSTYRPYQEFSTSLFFPEAVPYLSPRAFYDTNHQGIDCSRTDDCPPGGRMNQDDGIVRIFRRDRRNPREVACGI